ncbi:MULTISPECIES: chemotaxis protein CheA [Methylobacterium]|uniref:Chemotaxis protein CheA n=1 Tax=Methylobacterium oryzae CBMB20 TaxID=693986 RepID=A0A089P0S8_9HYPH|nr:MULTISPECIES: chemotaxis protein CheA [Methylobacterium]AIQ93277.1 signal transduction histidine kinase CheA [Methylobacterium oryzae CBMB20]MDH3029978.1 chemotaxis protein CheA [Methylobacterium fujisawaense]RUP14091.1 MAG: chemotaxis protein CheA [Methylobacterium sp.]
MTALDPADVFRAEAAELLACLETTLLDLGDRPEDRALIDTAFRALHTIKGSGAMFGFEQVAAFTHDFETAFDRVRRGEVPVGHDLVNVSLSAKDYIRGLIEEPEASAPIIGEAILAELEQLLGTTGRPAAAPLAPHPEPVADPIPMVEGGWQIGIAFAPDVLRNGTNPLALLDELRDLGACTIVPRLDALPELPGLDPESLAIGWDVTLRAAVTREAIEDVFLFVRDEMTLTLVPVSPAQPDAAPEPVEAAPGPFAPPTVTAPAAGLAAIASVEAPPVAPPAIAPAAPTAERSPARRAEERPASSVRVEAERLDELMDRVGELVIAQARLSQLAGLSADPGLKGIAEEIERLSARLRDTTMSIRMVAIGALFGRFRRLIHDLSRDLGKPVEFVTGGEDTELDKTVIERLADPLVHLIRNAIDHGIEAPGRRAAAAKAATGRITLTAEHVGAQVLVSVRDDGAGLDAARIRAKAEEKGLCAPGAVLTDQQVYQFLFAPGFSTAQEISALSGRGVGMDVVKKTIESLRGTIDIATEPGGGTTVALRLPLTLAIIEGLLIRVGEGRYVIPLAAVEECVELPAGERGGRGRDFLNIRGALVPFLRLRSLFGAAGEPELHQKVIIVAAGEARVGLVADQIIGNHQTVIKSLSKLHADVATFSGATILGDGTAALIIDVGRLVSGGGAEGARAYQEVA